MKMTQKTPKTDGNVPKNHIVNACSVGEYVEIKVEGQNKIHSEGFNEK